MKAKVLALFIAASLATAAQAQAPAAAPAAPAVPKPFAAGKPLSTTNEKGVFTPMSSNVKVYGSFRFSESCTFDPQKNLILAMNAGIDQALTQNDG